MHKTARHIIYWSFIYILWIYLKSNAHMSWKYALVIIPYVLIFILVFYSLRRILIPKYYNSGKTLKFLAGIIFISSLALGLWYFLMQGVQQIVDSNKGIIPNNIGGFLLELIQFYSPAVALLAWESYNDRQIEQAQIEALEKENLTNELKYLKAQVDPHFLINTLKSIKTQITDKKDAAPQMIMELSGVLDYVLYKGQNSKISLLDEIKTIEGFINLERLRKTGIKSITLETNSLSDSQLSPLILLSLVQYTFKIIDAYTDPKSIDIAITNISDQIITEINLNGIDSLHFPSDQFEDLKRQIEIEYPNKHYLSIIKNEDQVDIHLTLNQAND